MADDLELDTVLVSNRLIVRYTGAQGLGELHFGRVEAKAPLRSRRIMEENQLTINGKRLLPSNV
jgi:hypothetical protein